MSQKQKRAASSEWRPWHFITVSFIVTALSIIFLFAMRYVFNRIEKSAISSNQRLSYRIAEMGGMLIRSARLEISETEAPSEFVDAVKRQVASLKDQPIWSVNVDRLRAEFVSLSWISEASVQRVWPNEVRVHIELSKPCFVAHGKDSWALVNTEGHFLYISRDFKGDWVSYPVVFGLESAIRGEAAELNRSLIRERSELANLASLSESFQKTLGIQVQEFDIHFDEWNQSAVFTAKWKDKDSRNFKVSLRETDWKSRLTNLQFVLSDIKSKSFASAQIKGEFEAKWFVQLEGESGNG